MVRITLLADDPRVLPTKIGGTNRVVKRRILLYMLGNLLYTILDSYTPLECLGFV